MAFCYFRSMFWVDIAAMFGLGFLGTGHCIGMCGPLVLALPSTHPSGSGRFASHLFYHLGRVATYTGIGAVMGAVGAGLSALAPGGEGDTLVRISRAQVAVSLFAAVFLLTFGLTRLGLIPEPGWVSNLTPSKLPGFRRLVRVTGAKKELFAIGAFGLLMGLLPCGLSYAAFSRALPAGGPAQGALLVAAFGVGTAPGLLFLGAVASRMSARHRRLSDLLSGVLMIGMAVSLAAKALYTLI